jgi:hypothetical protein
VGAYAAVEGPPGLRAATGQVRRHGPEEVYSGPFMNVMSILATTPFRPGKARVHGCSSGTMDSATDPKTIAGCVLREDGPVEGRIQA